MKKQLFILSLSFLVLLSCSSGNDDSTSTVDYSLLLRKWYNLKDGSAIEKKCGKPDEYFVFSEPNIHQHFVIKNSYSGCNYSITDYGTWTRVGNTITITYDPSLNMGLSIIEIEELSLTTFSFLATGALGAEDDRPAYYVLSSY
tara:strand:- start:918 stop:1349 length:432 start_codon:yes stop_codon:yes gene_type:complete